MGCSIGIAGVNELESKPEYWRFQAGGNGTYGISYPGRGNGGMSPVFLQHGTISNNHDQVFDFLVLNANLGFMRMTQYHSLKLVQYAQDYLIGKKCKSVSLEFTCASDSAGDLDNTELNKRMTAWLGSYDVVRSLDKKYKEKYKTELEILTRVRPLRGCFFKRDQEYLNKCSNYKSAECFTTNIGTFLPSKCGEKITITSDDVMADHCKDWLKFIDSQSEPSDYDQKVFRPTKYPYPETGTIY